METNHRGRQPSAGPGGNNRIEPGSAAGLSLLAHFRLSAKQFFRREQTLERRRSLEAALSELESSRTKQKLAYSGQ